MQQNQVLQDLMQAMELTQSELADRVNRRLLTAGRRASITDRTVRYWLTGKTRWPQQAVREALEREFGCPIESLGFARPDWARPVLPEDDVHRRDFLAAAAAAALAHPTAHARVGHSDVEQLRTNLAQLVALDNQRGGHGALETGALAGAGQVMRLSRGASSGRINSRLLSLAADYLALAAWSCIDARELDRAQTHLDRAGTLAGMSGDPVVQMTVWNFVAMLAHHRKRPGEAVAAAQAAQATRACRQDPLYASLAHARTAIGHSDQLDRQAALRSLGYAEEALTRSEALPRPPWLAFYDLAELRALTAIVCGQLGEFEQSEAASHQALATIPANFRRNRAMATARLAVAQIGQGEADHACSSATAVLDLMAGDPLTGRMRTLLGDFHRNLLSVAPDTHATREWTDRARPEWSRT
ncbi:XRE family transcriptional regulator [Streptacidiphilus sp. MAP5-52]|uniref:XRE family transcriptional regulator n=1 Tax=Streptacidiphilus sp. MAP5-52 TaxID=3156267 RepID=UPI0035111ECB